MCMSRFVARPLKQSATENCQQYLTLVILFLSIPAEYKCYNQQLNLTKILQINEGRVDKYLTLFHVVTAKRWKIWLQNNYSVIIIHIFLLDCTLQVCTVQAITGTQREGLLYGLFRSVNSFRTTRQLGFSGSVTRWTSTRTDEGLI